jgi:voltage-gated potassium channel
MIQPTPGHKAKETAPLRYRVHEVLEQGAVGSRAGIIAGRALMLLVVINLVAVTAESVPELGAKYRVLFLTIETVSLAVFSLEYAGVRRT